MTVISPHIGGLAINRIRAASLLPGAADPRYGRAVLSARETHAAESLLASAWGQGVTVRSAEKIWDRSHILRLHLADGRSVVLKRGRDADSKDPFRGFPAEVAALEFLNGMDTPVAPRLLGADADVLIMEDLGPPSSLAHSLLARDPGRAAADLVAYGRALGAMHAWSAGRDGEFASIAVTRAGEAGDGHVPEPHWMAAIISGKQPLLRVAARLGLPATEVGAEIDSLPELLRGPGGTYTGLVHSDACPDNTHITDGTCRLFDFETSGWGPVALDAAYLLAPFPSCWCFASLPAEVADPALRAYREQVAGAGVRLGADWDVALAAALGSWVVARARGLARTLEEDGDWGTTTMRPRTLTWLRSFAGAAARSGVLPRFRALAEAMREELSGRWPETVVPDYPALARPGAPLARLPRGWESAT
jgi:Ser/Thr protein kinase RdoA (MazF antagonist)